jgi:nucleoside-diphosphate-sugar epimerase
MEDSRQRLLVTGAAGYVAGLIMPALRQHYQLRRIDVVDQRPVGDDEVVQADVCDVGLVTEACGGVAGVLHLAAKAFEDDFLSVLLPCNLLGTWSVFQAAARAGVGRVIFASTGQTVGANPPGTLVTPELPPRPISVYACTKLFGEALGRYYCDRHGMRVACLRLGWVVPADSPLFQTEATLPQVWCGAGDLADLVLAALQSEVDFATVLAVSPPATERFDVSNPYGWQPREFPAGPVDRRADGPRQ